MYLSGRLLYLMVSSCTCLAQLASVKRMFKEQLTLLFDVENEVQIQWNLGLSNFLEIVKVNKDCKFKSFPVSNNIRT